jgi:hypothetical protein
MASAPKFGRTRTVFANAWFLQYSVPSTVENVADDSFVPHSAHLKQLRWYRAPSTSMDSAA